MIRKFRIPRVIERSYSKAIMRLFRDLFAELNAATSPFHLERIIRRFARSPTFRRNAENVARAMVTHLFNDGNKTWRQAAANGSKGRRLYNALRREISAVETRNALEGIISRNAELISSMPLKHADKVAKEIADGYEKGLRPNAMLERVLEEAPHLTESHARLIARTETSKASTALTEVRCRAAELGWYVWRTSEDERVRSSHEHMAGVIISWSDPPSPESLVHEKSAGNYHAGNIYNCRCYPEPLIRFDQVSWPAKVYHNGKIERWTLGRFRNFIGGEL